MSRDYVCYVLESNPPRRLTYVGITNNLSRRIRQHNGELSGGAKYTTRYANGWIVRFVVEGFASKSEVLKFEYRLKRESRRFRKVAAPIDRRRRAIDHMLRTRSHLRLRPKIQSRDDDDDEEHASSKKSTVTRHNDMGNVFGGDRTSFDANAFVDIARTMTDAYLRSRQAIEDDTIERSLTYKIALSIAASPTHTPPSLSVDRPWSRTLERTKLDLPRSRVDSIVLVFLAFVCRKQWDEMLLSKPIEANAVDAWFDRRKVTKGEREDWKRQYAGDAHLCALASLLRSLTRTYSDPSFPSVVIDLRGRTLLFLTNIFDDDDLESVADIFTIFLLIGYGRNGRVLFCVNGEDRKRKLDFYCPNLASAQVPEYVLADPFSYAFRNIDAFDTVRGDLEAARTDRSNLVVIAAKAPSEDMLRKIARTGVVVESLWSYDEMDRRVVETIVSEFRSVRPVPDILRDTSNVSLRPVDATYEGGETEIVDDMRAEVVDLMRYAETLRLHTIPDPAVHPKRTLETLRRQIAYMETIVSDEIVRAIRERVMDNIVSE